MVPGWPGDWNNPGGAAEARRKLPRMPSGRTGDSGEDEEDMRLEHSALDILENVLFWKCSNIHKSRE